MRSHRTKTKFKNEIILNKVVMTTIEDNLQQLKWLRYGRKRPIGTLVRRVDGIEDVCGKIK